MFCILKKYYLVLCILTIGKYAIGQTIISNNGKYGIVDNDRKNIVIPIEYDTIIEGSKSESYGTTEHSHSFLLRKDDKSYFALKKYWTTSITKESVDGWKSYPPLESDDSIKWELLNQEFDTLYRLELNVFHYRKDATIRDFETYLGDTCFQVSKGIRHIVFRKDGKYGLLTFDRTSRIFGSYVVRGLRYKRIEYSIDNIQIHPAKYDSIMHLPLGIGVDSKLLVTLSKKKYGIINLGENIEIEPQFDTIPYKLYTSNGMNYCYAKKNGLWGMVYLKENNSVPLICIPYQYEKLDNLRQELRQIDSYNFYGKYPTAFYLTNENELLKIEFIVKHVGVGLATIKDSNGSEVLNRNYIPATEKQFTFYPKMNGKDIIQQKTFEYICTHNLYHYYEDETQPFFFILKLDRMENNSYNVYERGIEKKQNKPKSVGVFLGDSTATPISEFIEESENINYEIICDYQTVSEHYGRGWESTLFHTNFVLKSTLLEAGEYKHEFFIFKGNKIYELTSKHPIDYWNFMVEKRMENQQNPDFFILKFYTEIQGKKKTKQKAVCHYNVKTKQFYK